MAVEIVGRCDGCQKTQVLKEFMGHDLCARCIRESCKTLGHSIFCRGEFVAWRRSDQGLVAAFALGMFVATLLAYIFCE